MWPNEPIKVWEDRVTILAGSDLFWSMLDRTWMNNNQIAIKAFNNEQVKSPSQPVDAEGMIRTQYGTSALGGTKEGTV